MNEMRCLSVKWLVATRLLPLHLITRPNTAKAVLTPPPPNHNQTKPATSTTTTMTALSATLLPPACSISDCRPFPFSRYHGSNTEPIVTGPHHRHDPARDPPPGIGPRQVRLPSFWLNRRAAELACSSQGLRSRAHHRDEMHHVVSCFSVCLARYITIR